MVARQAVEQITDLRHTLRMMGAPLEGPAWLFGDNQSVVTSSTIPHSVLGKRWNALSYHRVREAIAGGWLRFEHLPGTENPADVLTKVLPWHKMMIFVEPILLWKGDTNDADPSRKRIPEGSDESRVNGDDPGPDSVREQNDSNANSNEDGWTLVTRKTKRGAREGRKPSKVRFAEDVKKG